MADAKIYVQVNKFAVKDIFDAKYKAKAITVMQKAAENAVKGKLTTDAPKEKGAKGWSLDGSLVSLSPDKAGKKLEAKVSMSISTWPGKSIKAMPSGTAAMAIPSADKVDSGDVEAVAEAAVESAMKSATKYMETNAP
ncbi:MAG: hypothetical protein K8R60_05320 [Burkholderiales bacterium]|nr:hypothetical protein [Burkholderiales bacterium]